VYYGVERARHGRLTRHDASVDSSNQLFRNAKTRAGLAHQGARSTWKHLHQSPEKIRILTDRHGMKRQGYRTEQGFSVSAFFRCPQRPQAQENHSPDSVAPIMQDVLHRTTAPIQESAIPGWFFRNRERNSHRPDGM
jgi:hypothetical protein